MAVQGINEDAIKDFFGLKDDDKGRKELKEILDKLVAVQYEHGQDIVKEGEEADGMYFLEHGIAYVFNSDGEQINVMHEGQYFGEYGVLAQQKRLSTVRSEGHTVCLKLRASDMKRILERHPNIYGELMKRVYGQVSQKHLQLLALSKQRRGILQHPGNRVPMTKLHMLLHYLAVAACFAAAYFLIPENTTGPVFALPLVFMIAYVLVTKRTVESLVISGLMAAMLVYRNGLSVSFNEGLLATMGDFDNVETVLIMALMGGMFTLIEASGSVTAFKKICDKKIKSRKGVMFSAFGILTATAIDDCLNLMCAATATNKASENNKVPHEPLALMYSFMPTVLSSFIPISLWAIFVMGTINVSYGEGTIGLFCSSIPFNFFSIAAVIAILALCLGVLPKSRLLKKADSRVEKGGKLWPAGSEKYLPSEEPAIWGKIRNLLLPIICLAVSSMTLKSVFSGSFVLNSACGLVATLIFMFFLYCGQGLMSPEEFTDHLMRGIASVAQPIVMYLLTMCFSALLDSLSMGTVFDNVVLSLDGIRILIPCILFLLSALFTTALGSSWAMYAISFPIGIRLGMSAGLPLSLIVGAISAAGIAGEKNCIFTGDELSVGTAVGCNPNVVTKLRISYSIIFTALAAVGYVLAGIIAV